MDLSQPLILPPDVHIQPLDELAPALQAKLGGEPDGCLVYRSGSRAGMGVIGPDMAELLRVFRTPHTVPEALTAVSKAWTADDQGDLEDCLRILEKLIREGLLVPPGREGAEPLKPKLTEGDRFEGFSVIRNVRVARDADVYQVRSSDGEILALKLARSASPGLQEMVLQDMAALERLDGSVAPRLVASGTVEGLAYGVSEWIEGVTPDVRVEDYRLGGVLAQPEALLALCSRILTAYADLHARGVIHGDVRPANILMEASGDVRIIDFGLSRIAGQAEESNAPRGGLEPYLDPEYARSLLDESPFPPLTEAAEQYCVAVLLYHLCTGEHYCRFGLYRREVLEQISTSPPRTFTQCGVPAWPEAEAVLRRALEKSPEHRFPSLREMADDWLSIPPRQAGESRRPAGDGGSGLVSETKRQLGLDGGFSRALLGEGCTASVNLGAAGISYGLYRISCATDDPEALAAAQVWLRVALDEGRTRRGFSGVGDDPPSRDLRRVSLHHSRTGVHLVRALLGRATQDPDEESVGTQDFLRTARRPSGNLDITHGRAGVLLGTSLLAEMGPRVARDGLAGLGSHIMDSLMEEVGKPAPISETSENLGVAHGWAGYLYAILRWCRATGTPPATAVFDRAAELAKAARPEGRGLRWRWVSPGSEDATFVHMPGWCNGSAGFVHLFSLASETFEHEDFLKIAVGAGWDVWDSPSTSGFDLCCGMGGRAYALLNLHRHTGDTSWLRRAERLADRAVEEIRGQEIRRFPHSLYRGELGIAVLLAELDRSEEATMPLFEPEDWISR